MKIRLWQFNDTRVNAHLLLLEEGEQFPQVVTIVMIANGHVNGDARGTYRLHQSEKLFVFAFPAVTQSAVAIDDQVSRPWVQCDDTLGCFAKAVCHVDPFVLVLLDG